MLQLPASKDSILISLKINASAANRTAKVAATMQFAISATLDILWISPTDAKPSAEMDSSMEWKPAIQAIPSPDASTAESHQDIHAHYNPQSALTTAPQIPTPTPTLIPIPIQTPIQTLIRTLMPLWLSMVHQT